MRVALNESNLQDAIRLINNAPGRARVAVSRAMNDSIRWANTQMRRAVSSEAQIPQKVLKENNRLRLRLSSQRKLDAAAWIGTNPLLAEKTGTPKPTKDGFRIGKHNYPGAFVVERFGGHIFLRADPSVRASAGRAPTAPNLPIYRPMIDLTPAPGTVERINAEMLRRFDRSTERLLALELEKATR